MEISGSLDEVSRPGLKAILEALKGKERKWDTLLAINTSRIARDPMLAYYVAHQCEKVGVTIRYSKIHTEDNASGELILSIFRAFDRFHSRLSAETGRAGSEANVRLGWRAGGRAPFGYRLNRHATGSMRNGAPVFKSKLVVDG